MLVNDENNDVCGNTCGDNLNEAVDYLSQLQTPKQASHRLLVDAVIQQYRSQIQRFLQVKISSPADQDDVFQIICFKIVQCKNLGRVDQLGAYVRKIATNAVTDNYRLKAKHHAQSAEYQEEIALADHALDPEQLCEGVQRVQGIVSKMEKLPPRCRQAVLMRRVSGLSPKIIAQRMGVSVSMVEKYITRGNQIMRQDELSVA